MAKSTDCIVVGGGIIGLAVARRLAMDGLTVRLLEKGQCGLEASWAAAGILIPRNPHRVDRYFHFQNHSLGLYAAFCEALSEESGIDVEYVPCGGVDVLLEENAIQIARSDVRVAAERKTSDGRPVYELHLPEQSKLLEPALSQDIFGALECRQVAQVRNPRLLQALVSSCRKFGVTIEEGTTVEGLLGTDNQVEGVQTNNDRVEAGAVVICAGAWSSLLDSRLETLTPVHPVKGQIVLMKLDKPPFDRVISRGKCYLVARRDGHVLLGSTQEPEAGFAKRNTAKELAKLMDLAVRLVPQLGDAPVVGMWSGLRPGTPDDKPHIGAVNGIDRLYAATGHFRSGLVLAPATAEAILAAIQGRSYDVDLDFCAPGRA